MSLESQISLSTLKERLGESEGISFRFLVGSPHVEEKDKSFLGKMREEIWKTRTKERDLEATVRQWNCIFFKRWIARIACYAISFFS